MNRKIGEEVTASHPGIPLKLAPRDLMYISQHVELKRIMEEMGSDISGKIEALEDILRRSEQGQRKAQIHRTDVRFVKGEESSDMLPSSSQRLAQEYERLKEENAKLRQLIRGYIPHVRLFRTATIVFALCTFSFLGWLWLRIDLINPVFAVLGMFVSIGFMLMARAAGKFRKEKVNTS